MKKRYLLLIAGPGMRDRVVTLLEGNYGVLTTEREEEALRLYREDPDRVAAVLVELGLPGLDVERFPEKLGRGGLFNRLPVLALCPRMPEDEDAACLSRGYWDILSPYMPRALLIARLNSVLREASSLTFEQFERLLRPLPSNIFLIDRECRYVFSTHYWHHINRPDDPDWTIRGKTDMEIRKDKENARKAMETNREIMATGKGTNYVIEEKEDGSDEFLELVKSPVYDENGEISGVIALASDVTERVLLRMELERRSRMDALTGLLNKRATEEMIRLTLSQLRKGGENGALLMFDVDNFKAVNDSFGHEAGDRVLSEIGGIFRRCFRSGDIMGRVGGDEFMVLMMKVSDPEIVLNSASRVSREVREMYMHTPLGDMVSVSAGAALFPLHGATFDDLYRAADQALYQVKRSGKNSCRVYSADPAARV